MNTDALRVLGACVEAREWAETQPDEQTAWTECPRGDWMLWLLGRLSGKPESDSRRQLVLCICACARLALKHIPNEEKRPLKAIQTAEAWARKKPGVTLAEVRAATAYAYVAYADADAAAAAYATADAAAAAYATDAAAAAYAATDAAAAAYAADVAAAAYATAATDAAAAAVYAAARQKALAECASIVRQHYPHPPKLEVPR